MALMSKFNNVSLLSSRHIYAVNHLYIYLNTFHKIKLNANERHLYQLREILCLIVD